MIENRMLKNIIKNIIFLISISAHNSSRYDNHLILLKIAEKFEEWLFMSC